jgi:hypothetical protein
MHVIMLLNIVSVINVRVLEFSSIDSLKTAKSAGPNNGFKSK